MVNGNVGLNWGQAVLNQAQNKVFCHLIEFGSYPFLEIACNNNLQQCLASSRGKVHEKKIFFEGLMGQNRDEISFFTIFSSLVLQFSFKLSRMIGGTYSCYQFYKKKFGHPNLVPTGQNQVQNAVFAIFLSLDIKFFLKLNTMMACDNV